MTDRPMKAVVLLMVGSVFYALGGVAVGFLTTGPAGLARSPGMDVALEPNWTATAALIIGIVCGVAVLLGALLTYTGVKNNIRLGSIISTMFSVAGIGSTIGGGLFVGLGMVLVGNVLALLWKPKELQLQPTDAHNEVSNPEKSEIQET